MGSLLSEVGSLLTAAGVASTAPGSAWRLMYREFGAGTQGTSSQAQMIAITPTGGFQQEAAEVLTRPTFQVLLRASPSGSTALEDKVSAVTAALNLVNAQTLGTHRYLDIQQQGEVLYLGRDENRRPVYSLNFMAFRSRTT